MRAVLLCFLCLAVGGCQFAGTAFTGVRKVATVLLDDRSFADDMNDTKLNVALRDSYVKIDPKLGVDVEPTVFEGKVLLTGALPNVELIEKIVEVTWQNPQVKNVYNYIRIATPPTLEQVNQDAAVSAKIRTQLTFTRGVSACNYKLMLENETLYMMGISKNQEELDTVISVAKNTVGVSKVIALTRFK